MDNLTKSNVMVLCNCSLLESEGLIIGEMH